MHKYDYSFLINGSITYDVLNLATSIYQLKGSYEKRNKDLGQLFGELEKIAKIQSIRSSNEIEGIITSNERIKEIVNFSSAPVGHDEQEIAGYRDALNYIHLNYEYLNINEETLLKLHEIMMSYTNYGYGGHYKNTDNLIIEQDQEGNRSIRFKPVSAKDTPEAMNQLILAYNEAYSESRINQLLLIPCFILDFLCIHPFRDGNSRMSRLLSILLLYKNDFDVVKYISFEQQINNYKGSYYEALKVSSDQWEINENSYIPFMKYFLYIVYLCFKEMDERLEIVESHKNKTLRIKETVLNSLVPISKKEISYILLDVSPTTIEKVLGEMVKDGKIVKVGKGRNTKYIKS